MRHINNMESIVTEPPKGILTNCIYDDTNARAIAAAHTTKHGADKDVFEDALIVFDIKKSSLKV